MITLYIKTHNKTGLKYFGKTKQENVEKYSGSGKYWKNHLKSHGNDISTEIYAQFEEECEELVKCAIDFSRKNNIVESNEWANLIEENGLDGIGPNVTDSFREKVGNYSRRKAVYIDENGNAIKISVKEAKERGLVAESKGRKYSDEINKKKGRIGNEHGMFGKKHPEEIRNKIGDKSRNTITCFDLETGSRLRIDKDLFNSSDRYVGSSSRKIKEYYENKEN